MTPTDPALNRTRFLYRDTTATFAPYSLEFTSLAGITPVNTFVELEEGLSAAGVAKWKSDVLLGADGNNRTGCTKAIKTAQHKLSKVRGGRACVA